MPVHQTISPIEATTKAVDALLAAIEGAPGSGAVAAYRAAIRRHGHQLADTAGPEALTAVVARIRADAADQAQADERERIVLAAWADIVEARERAA